MDWLHFYNQVKTDIVLVIHKINYIILLIQIKYNLRQNVYLKWNSWQNRSAAKMSNFWSQIVPHMPLTLSSALPSYGPVPFTRRTSVMFNIGAVNLSNTHYVNNNNWYICMLKKNRSRYSSFIVDKLVSKLRMRICFFFPSTHNTHEHYIIYVFDKQ